MALDDCKRGETREIRDARGALAVWQVGQHVPFPVQRLFAIYDVQEGAARGDHAHRECHQLFICFGGTVDIAIDDGHEHRVETLRGPTETLHVPPMNWVRIPAVPEGVTLLVLCSHPYDEADYIRDRGAFERETGAAS